MRIAIYGKGGGGKSTIASALSVCWARRGLRVLHVGCDPKGDSSLLLTGGVRPHSLLDLLADGVVRPTPAQFIHPGRHGIDCVEAGGPEPGTGCAGRGIARMFELFDETDLLAARGYDAVVFDVLGDVVCGGFAAPMRLGFAERVLLVVSDEPMSLFAANNMCRAIASHSVNRVSLAGLVVNGVDEHGRPSSVERFADAVGTTILGRIPRSLAIVRGEAEYRTAVEVEDDGPMVEAFEGLATRLLGSVVEPSPRPVPPERLFAMLRERAGVAAAPVDAVSLPVAEPPSDVQPSPVPLRSSEASRTVRGLPLGTPARVLTRDRGVVGGPASRIGVTALLRLVRSDGSPAPVEVSDVRWTGTEMRITLAGPAVGPVVARVCEAVPGQACFVDAGALHMSHDSVALSPAEVRLMQALGRRLKGRSFADLATPLCQDPEAVSEARVVEASGPDSAATEDRADELTWNRWDHPRFRNGFFFDAERRFRVEREVGVAGGVIVHHATRVCQASEVDSGPFVTPLFRTPWVAECPRFGPAERAVCVLSGVTDFDQIAGETPRLASALEATCQARPGEPVWLNVSCPTFIAGEDVHPVVRAAESRHGAPIFIKGVANLEALNVTTEMLRAHLHRARPRGRLEGPPRVNLVGFREGRPLEELRSLLEATGIRMHQAQLPRIRPDSLPDYLDAHLQVLWPEEAYEKAYREVLEPLEVPVLRAQAPFGVEGTRRFLQSVAAFFGREAQAEAVFAAVLDGCQATLDGLGTRCRRHRLGLSLTPGQHDLLDHPERLCGVPLTQVLAEMGFEVDVHRQSPGGMDPGPWLDSGLSGAYSELDADPRLRSRGLGQFSLTEFEPGLEGMVRSARRILARCEAPYVALYKGYAAEVE